ncbi:hypothetical protein [Vibrio rotiferianus]|uniref:hypothetical protein n=1 Tax=Vibrio rotiferianus TaxID=190895 RepID=UPI0039801DA3
MGKIRTKELFDIVRSVSNDEVNQRAALSSNKSKVQRYIWLFGFGIPLLISLITLFVAYKFQLESTWFWFGLFSLSICYISIILSMLWDVFTHRDILKRLWTEPFALIVSNAESNASTDMAHYRKLLSYSLEELRYLLLQLVSEKEAFSRRISLINGSIEKVGLLPGILALVVMFTKLPSEQSPPWVAGIALAIPFLHIFGVGMMFLISRLERSIKLVELAITKKI